MLALLKSISDTFLLANHDIAELLSLRSSSLPEFLSPLAGCQACPAKQLPPASGC